MRCDAWIEGRCRSCSLIERPREVQLAGKLREARALLAPAGEIEWLAPMAGREAGFRNKAKMVVAGTIEQPVLGILDPAGRGIDLSDCPLYPDALRAAFAPLAGFITRARLEPYDVPNRRGELKYLLLTLDEHSGGLMLRFVLRSTGALARIHKFLPELRATLPQLRVISVNIQPRHMAVLEGEQEILLGPDESLPMRLNGMDLHLRPGGFFQTNTEVAAALYRQARAWVEAINPASVWDLYCGIGGFALHCADGRRRVTGIELSEQAILSARRTSAELGLGGVDFLVGDATAHALAARDAPELVIVNPPRRGLGQALSAGLNQRAPGHIIYSSCNAASLARDLGWLPHYRARQARLFDMFPHTPHFELAVLLERRPGDSGDARRPCSIDGETV